MSTPRTLVTRPFELIGKPTLADALAVSMYEALATGLQMDWQPMLDAGGLSAQMAVEKELKQQNLSRLELGREAFVRHMEGWIEERIAQRQAWLRRMGVGRELRSTMDAAALQTVREAFLRDAMVHEKRVVWWCTRCLTAQDERQVVWHDDARGRIYHVRFGDVIVRTARPELLLATVGVAGRESGKVQVPLLDRMVPFVGGIPAGALTPGHDARHLQLAQQLGLEPVVILDPDGALNDHADIYEGLDRWEARQRIVADLKEEGFLARVETAPQRLAFCRRCDSVLESMLSQQWFHGDWCLSRQAWWGHRIPVWHCACGMEQAFAQDPTQCGHCGSANLVQDPDVLDRWYVNARLAPDGLFATDPGHQNVWASRGPVSRETWVHPTSEDRRTDVEAVCDRVGPEAFRIGLLLMTEQGDRIDYDERYIEQARDMVTRPPQPPDEAARQALRDRRFADYARLVYA